MALAAPPPTAANMELARLRRHFATVVAELRRRDSRARSAAQRARRADLIEALEAYADTGRFPINTRFPTSWEPSFVDDFGTPCAMAHLVATTGATHVVDRIAETANHARIADMRADAELGAWLDENGLGWDEAARIQPQYPPTPLAQCFCPVDTATTVLEVTAKALDGPPVTPLSVVIDAVHGDASGYTPGQVVQIESSAAPGTPLIVYATPTQGGLLVLNLVVNPDGAVACGGPFGVQQLGSGYETIGECVSIPKSELITHALTASCIEDLSNDTRFQITECPAPANTTSSSASTTAASTTLSSTSASTGGGGGTGAETSGGACSTSPAPLTTPEPGIAAPALSLALLLLRRRSRPGQRSVG